MLKIVFPTTPNHQIITRLQTMQAPKLIFWGGLLLLLLIASPVFAVQGLDAHGQSKVNKAMAQKWSQSDPAKSGYNVQQDKTIVNIGDKKSGGCNLNVGSVQPGQKAPKEIIVTTKEVINVCK